MGLDHTAGVTNSPESQWLPTTDVLFPAVTYVYLRSAGKFYSFLITTWEYRATEDIFSPASATPKAGRREWQSQHLEVTHATRSTCKVPAGLEELFSSRT